ncbi:MAG TPA: hypothetical protein VIL54_17020 [Natronosporangium sp.]
MALSYEELELQSTELLPAREVMTGLGGHGHGGDLLFGLINVNADVHDVDVIKDVDILTGKDSDVVDIENILIGAVGNFEDLSD